MTQFQKGDASAFDRIVSHYQGGLFHFLTRMLGDSARAEDLTQESFFRVYRSRDHYRPVAAFRSWLFTIANHLALNELRAVRRRRRIFTDLSSGADALPDELLANVPDDKQMAPMDLMEKRELRELLESLIEKLPVSQRAALELQRGQGFSYREISESLGLSTMAVKSLLVRARENLKNGVKRYLQAEKDNDP